MKKVIQGDNQMTIPLANKLKLHNEKVRSALERAEKGEIIDLTELMISREKVIIPLIRHIKIMRGEL